MTQTYLPPGNPGRFTTGDPRDYGKIEETFSPAALALIADWVEKRIQVMNP